VDGGAAAGRAGIVPYRAVPAPPGGAFAPRAGAGGGRRVPVPRVRVRRAQSANRRSRSR